MAFRHLAALREADRIHAVRLSKAKALDLTLQQYHDSLESSMAIGNNRAEVIFSAIANLCNETGLICRGTFKPVDNDKLELTEMWFEKAE